MTHEQLNNAVDVHHVPPPPVGWKYAGFSARALAFSIDQLILFFLVLVLTLPVFILLGLGSWFAWPFVTIFFIPPVMPVSTVIAWLYFAGQESSRYRGTFGKRICGLSVVDAQGARITFARASVRFFSKFLSAAIMLIGFIMAAFTERHQALHDMIAETLVVKKADRI